MSSSLRVFIYFLIKSNGNDSDGLLIDILPIVRKNKTQDVSMLSIMKAAAR